MKETKKEKKKSMFPIHVPLYVSLMGIIIMGHQSFPLTDQVAVLPKTFSILYMFWKCLQFSSISPHFVNVLIALTSTPNNHPNTPTIDFFGLIDSDVFNIFITFL